MEQRPIFIVGSPRSGTTLLRFMLSSHPDMWIPGETGFIPFLGVSPDRVLSPAEIRRVGRRIARLNRRWRDAAAATAALARDIRQPRLADVLDALFRLRMADSGASRWGDKTPGYVFHLDTIADIFRSAQFIHVIRDGRDAAVSAAVKWAGRLPQRLYMDEYYLLRVWSRAVRGGRAAGTRLGEARYIEIRYEELVREPEASLRRICDFLDERFHPDMLRHERLARDTVSPGGHVEVREPISTERIGRYRREMSPFGLWLAERAAGATLEEFGYRLAATRPPSAAAPARSTIRAARYAAVRGAQWALEACGVARLNRAKRRRRADPGARE